MKQLTKELQQELSQQGYNTDHLFIIDALQLEDGSVVVLSKTTPKPKEYFVVDGKDRIYKCLEVGLRGGATDENGIESNSGHCYYPKFCKTILFSTKPLANLPVLELPDEAEDEELACSILKDIDFKDEKEMAKAVVAVSDYITSSKKNTHTTDQLEKAIDMARETYIPSNNIGKSKEQIISSLSPKITGVVVEVVNGEVKVEGNKVKAIRKIY